MDDATAKLLLSTQDKLKQSRVVHIRSGIYALEMDALMKLSKLKPVIPAEELEQESGHRVGDPILITGDLDHKQSLHHMKRLV